MSKSLALDSLIQDIQKTPDPIKIKGAHTKGRRHKLGIMAFWFALFESNELLPRDKKMTNAEIARQMNIEFPGRKAIENLIESPNEVNTFRAMYNTGTLVAHQKGRPRYVSFRYNENGEKVDLRSGRVLTAAEISAIIEKYTNWKPSPRTKEFKPRTRKKKKKTTSSS